MGAAERVDQARPVSSGSRRPVEPGDLFEFQFVTAADLSPDGSLVVMAVTRSDLEANTDHVDLVLVEVDGGRQRRPTHLDAVNTSPAFSPDGTQIAFLSTRDGTPQLHSLPVAGGEARPLTTLARGVTSGPSWSPDGSQIAFTAHGAGEPRDPSRPYRVQRAAWHAEGLGLVEDNLHDVHVVDPAAGDTTRVTDDAFLNASPAGPPTAAR